MCFAGWPVIVNVSSTSVVIVLIARLAIVLKLAPSVELPTLNAIGTSSSAAKPSSVRKRKPEAPPMWKMLRVPDVEVEVRDHDLDHARAVRPRRLLERDVCADRQAERSDRDVAFRVE